MQQLGTTEVAQIIMRGSILIILFQEEMQQWVIGMN